MRESWSPNNTQTIHFAKILFISASSITQMTLPHMSVIQVSFPLYRGILGVQQPRLGVESSPVDATLPPLSVKGI
jgi:hypothetical protein